MKSLKCYSSGLKYRGSIKSRETCSRILFHTDKYIMLLVLSANGGAWQTGHSVHVNYKAQH